MKALRKKVRSMREGTDVQKEDDSILASARRPEDTEHAQSQGSPGANGKSFVHSTEIQRTKSPERDRTKKGTVESHSVPATPDATKKPKSTSLENVMNQNATEKALPPTPPVSRRKGASSPNVPVPKPSPSHSRVNSTPHIPSHTGLFNNSFSNQMQTRNVDASPVLHTAHVPHMAGSAQRELGTQHFASTNFDPLAPKNPATPDQDTVTLTENPPNNFDPFSSAAPPNQYRGTGLQYNQGTAMNVMQPAPTFAMNHNNLAVPVYGLPGTSFERLDQMTMQNQQRMQGVDLSQIRTPSSSVHERQQHILQQSNCQESLQPVLLVPQQTFEVHVDSQMHPNQFAPDSGSKTNVEQNISTQGPWSQQQHGSKMRMETQLTSDGVPALSSQSRLNMSSDPFDELLNRANQS